MDDARLETILNRLVVAIEKLGEQMEKQAISAQKQAVSDSVSKQKEGSDSAGTTGLMGALAGLAGPSGLLLGGMGYAGYQAQKSWMSDVFGQQYSAPMQRMREYATEAGQAGISIPQDVAAQMADRYQQFGKITTENLKRMQMEGGLMPKGATEMWYDAGQTAMDLLRQPKETLPILWDVVKTGYWFDHLQQKMGWNNAQNQRLHDPGTGGR